MTVKDLCELDAFNPIMLPSPEREIKGAYIGDLLSWVMGRARADEAWITIMTNINVLAVATLTDVSCIILSEGVMPDEQLISTAKEKEINLISCNMPSYEAAKALVNLGV